MGVHRCIGRHLGRYSDQVAVKHWPCIDRYVHVTDSRLLQPIYRWLVVTWPTDHRHITEGSPTDHQQLVDVGYCLLTNVMADNLGWIHRLRPTVGRHAGLFKSATSAATWPIVSNEYQSTGILYRLLEVPSAELRPLDQFVFQMQIKERLFE